MTRVALSVAAGIGGCSTAISRRTRAGCPNLRAAASVRDLDDPLLAGPKGLRRWRELGIADGRAGSGPRRTGGKSCRINILRDSDLRCHGILPYYSRQETETVSLERRR